MAKDEIIFGLSGGIDTDSDVRNVAKGDYRMFDYCRLGQVSGEGFSVITSWGTVEVPNGSINSEDVIVGACEWVKQYAIVYLVYRPSADDQIWMYDISLGTHTLIAESSEFNFNPDYPVFHLDIIEDLAKWAGGKWDSAMFDPTDGSILYNFPSQLNLRKALDGEYTTIDWSTVSAIKWPPPSPSVVYFTDQTRADNKLRRKLYRFRVQYIYENNEETVWSMWSNLALPTISEFISGNNWPDSSQDNGIRITFATGTEAVKRINLAVQTYDDNNGGVDGGFGIFIQLNKSELSIPNDSIFTYDFYGNVSLKPISNLDGNYDRLPIWSRCQSVVDTSKVAYTNFIEGYDKDVELDVTTTPVYNEIIWNPLSGVVEVLSANTSISCFLSWVTDAVFIVAQGNTFSGSFTLTNGQVLLLTYTINQTDIEEALLEATPELQMGVILEIIANNFAAQAEAILGVVVTASGTTINLSGGPEWAANSFEMTPERQTLSTPSFKVGATHPFGIVYGDEAFRDSTVITGEGLSMFVPWYADLDLSSFTDPRNPFTVSAQMTINHLPPIWAKYYWIVWRKATEIADFSQWVINAFIPAGEAAGTAIVAESNRFVISLDKFYIENYNGASINHVPQKGDVARFIRQRLNSSSGNISDYVPTFFELEVMEYLPSAVGSDGRSQIVVEIFDRTLIDPDTWTGQLIEIYTPQPTLNEDGTLFVAPWRDGSETLKIGNAHTENRFHKALEISQDFDLFFDGVQSVYVYGDVSTYVGATITLSNTTFDPPFIQSGVIATASYIATANPLGTTQTTLITIDGGWTQIGYVSVGNGLSTITFGTNQVVVDGVSVSPAELNLTWGDVYVRQRNYATGYNTGSFGIGTNAFWFIEDPHYSDYWLSNIHQYGRLNIELDNAKQQHRIATSIHSDSYFTDTDINGTSSFSLLNDNIMDMNPLYGEVVRTVVSGREEKTLKCIQERKENSIYIKHYPDVATVPSGDLRVDRETTFSAWYPLKGIFGCVDAGSVILYPNGEVFYYDRINGVFVNSGGSGQVVISERDINTGRDFKFRTKTKEITARLNSAGSASYVRSYVDILNQEVGFCFAYEEGTSNFIYEILTYDVLSNRWRSRYDYNFEWFANFGQTLVGWGTDSQMYLHNQSDSFTFHGDEFTQKLTVVSNADPLRIKRFQNLIQRANKTFDVKAYTDSNQSYGAMETEMADYLFKVYEGYSMGYFRRNKFSPLFTSEEMAMMNGEEMRSYAVTMELTYTPTDSGAELNSVEVITT
jgi:hypothetical protein